MNALAKAISWQILLMFFGFAAQAQFTFTTNNGTITITRYTGSSGNVIIPSETNGYPVTIIGASAFANIYSMTNVTIPDSITSIGTDAFYECFYLTSATIGSNVTSIGADAFNNCWDLIHATLGNNVTSIGQGAFMYCDLTNVTIPNSVTNIGLYTFGYCTNLANVIISNSVITGYEFEFCHGLTNLTAGNGVTNVGSYAFWLCTNLHQALFKGNAPSADNTVFTGESGTVYYLPGTTGWKSTLGGWPTALYPPPPALGISTYGGGNPAVFFPSGSANNYVLQMTTNLASGTWITATSSVPISGFIITNPPSNVFFRFQLP